MKKATRSFPTRQCENCGKAYHARKGECPNCGTPNPTRASKARRVRVKRRIGRPSQNHEPIEAAIRFVESAGSAENARAALETIERIKGL